VNQVATDLWQQQLTIRIDDYLVGPIAILTGDEAFLAEL
jgi:ribosomal protein L10